MPIKTKLTKMSTQLEIKRAEETNEKTSDVIKWDDMVKNAAQQKFGERIQMRTSYVLNTSKEAFIQKLFSDAKNINPKEPEEVRRNTVDVDEKIYYNNSGGEDATTVKIVNCIENSEGQNYTTSTTKGVEWGASASLGLQFGLPQVGASGSVGGSFKRTNTTTTTQQETKSNRVERQSHHEETVKIPPGKKAVVKMTSYRIRYKLRYTMEYKIEKDESVRFTYDPCGFRIPFGLDILFAKDGFLEARELLETLPGFRVDEKFVYITQEGELDWTADRMEVDKKITDV